MLDKLRKQTEKKRLDASVVARVGAAPRRATKTFEVAYEDLSPEIAEQVGLAPGEVGETEYWFEWKPYGWQAVREWAETAKRAAPEASHTAYLVLALNATIHRSNFGLEDQDYNKIQPAIMEWVCEVIGVKAKADLKKSPGSSGGDPSKEPNQAQNQTPN